ncbi:uncharacterized protein LOC122509007 [Leptopilina heterotoma]|uniref:uncharacterized protein LOC122509007 n=1 Tax=Leptopilina heterotoma TaxID=63436 RepID=UPI001CA7CAEF|nr:uncharacterized protein LOC122509007 [Leptopilina heterotoma]XP_043478681.1 uncharacterized protein LOC122509007 [Leptopilina heterotoma]
MPSTKKTSFQDNWLTNPLYEKCIKRVPDNIHAAHCTICYTNFGLSNMGKGALDSHISGKKHKKAVLDINSSLNISMFGVPEESRITTDENQPLLIFTRVKEELQISQDLEGTISRELHLLRNRMVCHSF